eukprot:scaffold266926_cov14-Tisochrysis_lutea.AAC.1
MPAGFAAAALLIWTHAEENASEVSSCIACLVCSCFVSWLSALHPEGTCLADFLHWDSREV